MHISVYFWYHDTNTNITHSLHDYTDQTCLKWNLVIMENCLKHETFMVPRIQTSSTCINWNLPAVGGSDPLWFLYGHVSVFQVLVPQYKYWTQSATLHVVLVPQHKYWTQFALLHLVLVPQRKYSPPPPLLPLEAVPCLLLLHEETLPFLLSNQPKP